MSVEISGLYINGVLVCLTTLVSIELNMSFLVYHFSMEFDLLLNFSV